MIISQPTHNATEPQAKPPPSNDLVLRAARRERTERTPVWLMRQAGRADPHYLKLRAESGLSLREAFRHPDVATELSLLPMRLGVDAIIMFQDILTPLAPMGADFDFRPMPVLAEPIRSKSQIEKLNDYDPAEQLDFVGRTLQNLNHTVGSELPILGFAGAPLTLAFFLIEGRSPLRSFENAQCLMRTRPDLLHQLLEKLCRATIRYLDYQIACGAHAVQLFESVADLLTSQQYREFAHRYHLRVFSELRDDVPRILFAKERPDVGLMAECGAEVLSVGKCVDLTAARKQYGDRVAFQGNVDNRLLLEGPLERIEQVVQACVAAGGHTGHILNLNHGLLEHTPFEHIEHFVRTCRQTRLPLS